MNESNFARLEKLFLALGDKTRLKLLALMADGPVSVGFLADTLAESQPKVSRHLAYLRNTGIVEARREGKWMYYGISAPEDVASTHILEAVLRVIAARPSGEAYFAKTIISEGQDVNNIYADAYKSEDFDQDRYEERDELPIFLL